MPKINHEEYVVLKDLDDKWKWIARDEDRGLYAFTEKPVKKYDSSLYWDTETGEPYAALELFDEIHLFQFIQWEDENPYNIAELIEEYEDYEESNKIIRRMANRIGNKSNESEETEVKDIEWLKNELREIREKNDKGNNFEGAASMNLALKLINQLDEPEVLSDKWIDDNQILVRNKIPFHMEVRYAVPIDRLQNLLVPKQEEVKRAQIPEWIIEWYQGANNEFSTLEDVFSNLSHDTNYNIMDSDKFRSRIMKYGGFSKMYEALSHIYFGAYEIEEEQKYVVEFPNITGSNERYLVQGDDGDLWVDGDLDYLQRVDIPKHIFTEEEIKSFDKDYWAFAKPVEELEE